MIERGVLYIVDPSADSVNQHVLTLLKYLNRARYKPYLVVSNDEFLIEHAKKMRIDYISVPGITTANKLSVGGVAKQIQEFAEGLSVSLIHSHGYQACYVASQVAKALNVPHLSTIHTINTSHQKKGLLSLSDDKIAALPNYLIAVSEEVRKTVDGINKIALVYNGIEMERFGETLDTEHLFRELGITKEHSLIGTIARLSSDKGTSIFLEAAAILAKERPEAHFVIVGDGEEANSLKKKAAGLGIADKVHFLGFRRDVAHILKSLDVVVIPNLSPGLPMVLLEALASIKPVVITDIPGVREAVAEDSVDFVPVNDPQAIAGAVEELLTDRRKAEAKAQTGQRIVKEKFTIQKMIKATESLYLELAG